jgi:predicted MFS family arabinose efflux permease
VGLFPAVARLAFGIDEDGSTYKWLYATWGLGASLGGLAIGTAFVSFDKRRLMQWGFAGFSASLFGFALSTSPTPAFIVGFFLGFFYFFATTALSTVLQGRLEAEVRGRVMALYIMSFGGTVPLGNMLFGPLLDEIGPRPILILGTAWAAFLAWWCNIVRLDRAEQPLAT